MRTVEAAIRARGPLGNADFQTARPGGASGWWSWKPATHALDFLWMSGRTSVHSRAPLPEALRPARAGAARRRSRTSRLDAAAFRRWHLERSLHAMGAATETDLRMYLTFPRIGAGERARRAARDDAARRGGGDRGRRSGGRWYALARDLDAARRRRPPPRAVARRDAALAVRFVPVAPRARGAAVRLRLPHRGVRPARAAQRRLLRPAAAGRRTARSAASTPSCTAASGGSSCATCASSRGSRRATGRRAASWGAVSHARGVAGLAEAAWSLAAFTGAERIDVGRVSPPRLRRAVVEAISAQRA